MQLRTIAVVAALLLLVGLTPALTGDAKKPEHIPHRGSGR